MAHSDNTVVYALAGLGFGGHFLFQGLKAWRQKRYVQNMPLSKISAVAMGDAELTGEIKPLSFLKTKFSGQDCVYCSYTTETRYKNSWRVVDKGEITSIFLIDDKTGEILLNPSGAQFFGAYTYQTIGFDGRRYTEYSLFPNQIVLVEGCVSLIRRVVGGKEREEKIIGRRDSGEFILSAYSEEGLVTRLAWSAPLKIFGGMALFLVSLGYLVFRFNLDAHIR